jgi:hypothetical protein
MQTEIIKLGADSLMWEMGTQDSTAGYQIMVGNYLRTMKVDPYPAYMADIDVVKPVLEMCEQAFPLPKSETRLYLLGREDVSRFNGVTYHDNNWKLEKETTPCACKVKDCKGTNESYPLALTIALSGKRIPIHPAMLRYLVSHEYGHMAFYYAARWLGYHSYSLEETLQDEYMKIRGVRKNKYTSKYKGGEWHIHPGEIIANDFRVIFTGQEREFWPHNIPLPDGNAIYDWWENVCRACGFKFVPVRTR